MVNATVGTMFLDFPRLLNKIDSIAGKTDEKFIVQTGMSELTLDHCECFDFKSHDEILELQRQARVVICHGGIGAMLDALKCRVPIVVVPRLKRYKEHMNDHQLDIAKAIERRGWGRMIVDIEDLDDACANPPSVPEQYQPAKAQLIKSVKKIVDEIAMQKAHKHSQGSGNC